MACIPGLDVVPAAATRLSAVIHAQEYIRQLQEREKKLRIMLAGTRRGNGTREEAMAAIEKELEETEPPPSQVSPVTAAEATEARTVADEPGTTNEKTHNTMQDEPRSDNLSGEMPSVAAVSGGPEEERGPATGTFEPRDSEDVRRITN